MMFARMFLGMHYATDVLVGSIVYVVVAIVTFYLYELLYQKVEMKNKYEWLIYVVIVVSILTLIIALQFL